MSNQERANEMGWQHRMIRGAMGRRATEAYSASSAVPWPSLPSGRLRYARGCAAGTGEMREVEAKEAELGGSSDPGYGDPPFTPSGPKSVDADHPQPTPNNWEFSSLASYGGGVLCLCLP